MRVGSLFSGGGLGDLGLYLAGMEIAWQVEIDDYCRKVLQLRWPDVPKYKDILEVNGAELVRQHGTVDLVAGGFPCQPWSVAGKRRGVSDDRNLWPEMLRVISEARPHWVLAENNPGIIRPYLDQVLSDLEAIGYSTGTVVFPAHGIGAPHLRERVWIIANSNGGGLQEPRPELEANRFGQLVQTKRGTAWEAQPAMDRVVDVCANRVDRLKLLGNGQVVQVTEWIGRKIMEFEQSASPLSERRECE